MEGNQTHQAILTGSLRRVLLGAVFAVCALAAAQIIAVSKLQREIGHWAWTSEINAQREQLLIKIYNLLGGLDDVEMSDVLNSFENLRLSIAATGVNAGSDPTIVSFAVLESEARDLFVQAEEFRGELVLNRQAIQRNVDALQELSGSWSSQLRAEERRILRDSERIHSRSRDINDLKTNLTSVLLGAQLLQQQVITVERLIDTSTPQITRSSLLSLDASGLPAVCAPGDEETGGRLCVPSVSRVLSALERLQTGDIDAVPQNVNLALLGLQAYIRAGQARLDALSGEHTNVLTKMREARERITTFSDLNASIGRINRILLDIESALDQPMTSPESLEATDRQMRSYISQVQVRMRGVLSISQSFGGDPDFIASTTGDMSENWEALRERMSKRIDTLGRFDDTMDVLSSEIASHAEAVRRDTTLWVSLYHSNFLLLAGALLASVFGLLWFARRRFITPLARVTGAIIGLARGEIERPILLRERAFGFDKLGKALEQLRTEMVERHKLAERNSEQQKIIEANLSELERTSEEMEWMAMHDPLTGLGNRRQADLGLADLSKAGRSSQSDFCVMQVDIDRFKAINDALGHPAGDYVLKSVAGILKECAGPDAKCYRIGGDEFLVVLSGVFTKEYAARLAASIIGRIEVPIDFKGHRCNVGASIGIAFGRDTAFDAMQCVIRADLALYQVKKTGRGAFEFFTDDLEHMSSRRNEISDRLIAAIEQKTFLPFYQPQFDAGTRRLRGVEVLCRWHDDDLGWISPGEFLSVANELDAVGKIDEILFEKVAFDLQELSESGHSLPRVSFNITADRLLKSNLARELSERMQGYTKIALELLESMSLDNPTESVAWALAELREHGIDVEIDDFGSDRASLAGLMAISPQAMKIDQAIVTPITHSLRHRDLVKKIIDIGAALNIEVIAEGVETEEHAEMLKSLGCDVLQGFGLAKPMPFADLAEFCARLADAPGDAPSAVA